MSYLSQDGFMDWISGRSAPPSVIPITGPDWVRQYGQVEDGIRNLRGVRPQNRSKATSPSTGKIFGVQVVPKATCDDVKVVWNKYGKRLVDGNIAKITHSCNIELTDVIGGPARWLAQLSRCRDQKRRADLRYMLELRELGKATGCWVSGRSEYSRNDLFWPMLRNAAILAGSLQAKPSAWELVVESVQEAAADVADKVKDPLFKVGAVALAIGAYLVLKD